MCVCVRVCGRLPTPRQIKEGQRFIKCGEQAAAGMSKADVVQYLGGVETAQLTLQEDTAAYLAGKQAKEAAKNKWVLHRRYSQFNELKENLAKSHSAVIKARPRPPRRPCTKAPHGATRTTLLRTRVSSFSSARWRLLRREIRAHPSPLCEWGYAQAAGAKGGSSPRVLTHATHAPRMAMPHCARSPSRSRQRSSLATCSPR